MLTLVIGNKNYSSWSMRAWMALRLARLPFDEVNIEVYSPGARDQVKALGGETGLVPVLIADGAAIWDTMAIIEYLHELRPGVWPAEPLARARARSYAGEVHSSFNALREAMPCNTRARNHRADISQQVRAEIARIADIWSRVQGDWLFGPFCAADIMFAPIAARFRTYDVELRGAAKAYEQRLLAHPLAVEWFALGQAEPMTIDRFEAPHRAASVAGA